MIGSTVGSYRIIAKLGEGGMGVVYLAEHPLIGRKAAVKVLAPELSRKLESVGRFFNEARSTTMLRHPGVVDIFDFGHHESGSAYIIMEFLEGSTLASTLERLGRLPLAWIIELTRQVGLTLAAAHAQGIVHRDLKPDNIFLVPDPTARGGMRTKLLDFGIAKLIGEIPLTKTRTGTFVGTPTYGSPEQCRGAGEVDQRSDVYSLGCVVYEMTAGQPPFVGVGSGDVIAAHICMPAPLLGERAPEWLGKLVGRMLSKDAEARPTMGEVVTELETHVEGGGPTRALGPGSTEPGLAPCAIRAEPTRIEKTPVKGVAAMGGRGDGGNIGVKPSPAPTIPMPTPFQAMTPTAQMPAVSQQPALYGPTIPMPTVMPSQASGPPPPSPTIPMPMAIPPGGWQVTNEPARPVPSPTLPGFAARMPTRGESGEALPSHHDVGGAAPPPEALVAGRAGAARPAISGVGGRAPRVVRSYAGPSAPTTEWSPSLPRPAVPPQSPYPAVAQPLAKDMPLKPARSTRGRWILAGVALTVAAGAGGVAWQARMPAARAPFGVGGVAAPKGETPAKLKASSLAPVAGATAAKADGVTAAKADGVTAAKADGVTAKADGVTAAKADGVAAKADSLAAAARTDGLAAAKSDDREAAKMYGPAPAPAGDVTAAKTELSITAKSKGAQTVNVAAAAAKSDAPAAAKGDAASAAKLAAVPMSKAEVVTPAKASAPAPTKVAAPMKADALAPAKASLPAPAAPATVTLIVESRPSGADVYRDGGKVRIGKTPLTQTIPRGSDSVAYILRHPGYRNGRVWFATGRDAKKSVALRRVPAAPASPSAALPSATAADSDDGPLHPSAATDAPPKADDAPDSAEE